MIPTKDMGPNSQTQIQQKTRRLKKRETSQEFCIALFNQLLLKSGEAAFDLCQTLATGLNPKTKWQNGEAMILCLDSLLQQPSAEWTQCVSLGLIPLLWSPTGGAAEHRSVSIRKIFFSVLFNAANFLLSGVTSTMNDDLMLYKMYPLMEQGLHDKNATIRGKLHTHLSNLVQQLAFQNLHSLKLVSIFYRLWSSTLFGLLDISKTVRSKSLESVKLILDEYSEHPGREKVVFTWVHNIHEDLIDLIIRQLIVIITAQPDSPLCIKSSQKIAQDSICSLIKIPLFQSKVIIGALHSRSPEIQSVFKEAVSGLAGSVVLDHGVYYLRSMNRLDAEARIKAFVRIQPDVQLEARSHPVDTEWSLVRVCIHYLYFLCKNSPLTKDQNHEDIFKALISIKRRTTRNKDLLYYEVKVLRVLHAVLVYLVKLEDENWIRFLMIHWVLKALKIILERQPNQNSLVVHQSCHSLLEIYSSNHCQSKYPCLIQSDFINTIMISSSAAEILLPSVALKCLKGHTMLNALTALHQQCRLLERLPMNKRLMFNNSTEWIIHLASSQSSPRFIQLQAHRSLVKLASQFPSLLNPVIEMVISNFENDRTNESVSWMSQFGIYICNKLMKTVPDDHRITSLSRLIVPLCHLIPQQNTVSRSLSISKTS
eukprot:g2780.t1